MAWFTENWFWILIFIAFVGMHLFGHGGHGGRGAHEGTRGEIGAEPQGDDPRVSEESGTSARHRH